MPINALRKDIPRGTKPPVDASAPKQTSNLDMDEEREKDLAALEAQELWEAEEEGITRWSGDQGSRYSDSGA